MPPMTTGEEPSPNFQGQNSLEVIDNSTDFAPEQSHTPAVSNHPGPKRYYDNLVFDDATLNNIVAIQIQFPSDTNFFANGIYNLDPNGYIKMPLIGMVKIKDEKSMDVAKLIESAFTDFVNYPTVKIHLLMRIALLGGFRNPGLYYAHPATPLWDIISRSGGPIREDGFKKMRWWRGENVQQKNLNDIIRSGKTLEQLSFQSGDVITVTQLPKLGFWGALRTEVLPFILMLGSLATLYITYLTFDTVNQE